MSHDPTAPASSPFLTEAHHLFRATMHRFVAREIEPYAAAWDEAESFPRALYERAAETGLLQIGFPADYGGVDADPFFGVIAAQELARAGCGGIAASLLSHTIALPPIVAAGPTAMKQRVLPEVLAGRRIAALAITEPECGSDVAALNTTALRVGEEYVINGSKTFITSGMRADYLTVAVRTGGPGKGGVSLLLVETSRPGLTRTPLRKMGWWASDTATLYFDAVRVPAVNLIGRENEGFGLIMRNFNRERLGMAAGCISSARLCLEETLRYARARRSFGQRLVDHQVVRHKLADMAMRIEASQAWLEQLAWQVMQGEDPVASICMLKNQATLTMEYCAREAVQTFGGAGYMRGTKVERIYREVRVNAIGGGAEEIMRELAARQWGWVAP